MLRKWLFVGLLKLKFSFEHFEIFLRYFINFDFNGPLILSLFISVLQRKNRKHIKHPSQLSLGRMSFKNIESFDNTGNEQNNSFGYQSFPIPPPPPPPIRIMPSASSSTATYLYGRDSSKHSSKQRTAQQKIYEFKHRKFLEYY